MWRDNFNCHLVAVSLLVLAEEKGTSPRRNSGKKCMSFLTTLVVKMRVKIVSRNFSQEKFTLVIRQDSKFWNFEFLPALKNFSQEKFTLVLRTASKFRNFEFLPALRNFSQEKFSLQLAFNSISPSSGEFLPGEIHSVLRIASKWQNFEFLPALRNFSQENILTLIFTTGVVKKLIQFLPEFLLGEFPFSSQKRVCEELCGQVLIYVQGITLWN